MATYLILSGVVIVMLALWAVFRGFVPTKDWLLALLALLILTAVFDNFIILAGIVDYDARHILGIRIGLAPIEDFFYPIGSMLLASVLWHNKDRDE